VSSLVLDASITLALQLQDENKEGVDVIGEQIVLNGAIVPFHWPIEVANSLAMAARRKRITMAQRDEIVADLQDLQIEIDRESELSVWGSTLLLSDSHGLTVYDAAYLELALRLKKPLATLDKALASAARKEAVVVCGPLQ
jgi:predicted nucleic acid-binding protein